METKKRTHILQKKILVAIELYSDALGLGKTENFTLGSFQEVFNICHGGLSKLALWEVHNNKIVYIR